MKYTKQKLGTPGICLMLCALLSALAGTADAQVFGTTTVQGTVYLANGAPGSGTLQISWPAFSTAANQAVAAGRTNVTIAADGFVSVKLAPNLGALPAGLFYTAVYHLSDGTTSTEYWVVPAAAQAALAQVRAQVMPAAQAVQAVNKAYVDQSIAELTKSQVTSGGGTLTGPLYLNGDPVTSPQAATKHYVDNQFGQALSINGGAANGPLTAVQLGAAYQVDQFPGNDFGAKLQACINALNSTYGGSCDARNFSGTLAMASNLAIAKANITINLPCATIATSSQIVVTAGTRNVTLHGCASRGTSAVSGSQGGTVFMYSGSAAMIQVGDSTYTADTLGFHLDNVVLNTTSSAAATAQAVTVWRAQELHLDSLYVLGNANQTGITLDGTGNYTGGTLQDVQIGGFQTAINAIGHQVANAAPTDWVNASTFVRLHINCPTANGIAIAGTTGINLAQGDGNTITGGDVEGCATALHLGPNAQNNTIVGLRNENSTNQVVADAGSAYNNWITGGTMFTGKLTDNGTRNSFLDTFHRSFNALNGDWFGSQQDSTLTNHYRLGIGSGNERGLLHRYQTDSGYRWTMGLSDATAGEQYYTVLDELNGVNRLSIGQYNTGQGSSNNQTVVNAAGTGAVILNGSNNAGSGGVVFGSGGASSATVATINNAGNAQFNGSLQVSGASTFLNSTTVKNQADAEVDAFLWAGATAPQKESVIYKDWNGNSQWYLVKDTSNNWALNSAVGGVDSLKAYQSTNSGDTYLDAANNTGVVRVNYEPGSGSAFNVYGGSSGNLYASFNGTTGIKFPGLAAGSGKNCVQIDNSGYLSNTGLACAGSSVGAGTSGQFAYYPGNGSTLAGMSAIPIGSGGTGATSSSSALASLGGLPMAGGALSGPLAGTSATFSGDIQAQNVSVASDRPNGHQAASANAAVTQLSVLAFGAKADFAASPQYNCSVANGTNVLYCPGVTFTSADVGKSVGFFNITSLFSASAAPSVATITGFTDATHVVLGKSAIKAGGGLSVAYGTDDVPAFNACAAAAYGASGGTCKVPAGNYFMASAPYSMLWGAYDDGSYGTPAGGTGAVVAATLGSGGTSGQIASYTISNGGSGYTPSSSLQMTLSGGCGTLTINQGPCGWAYALANTNSSGVVTSITPVYGGYGFLSAPTVTVQPLGGDGAAATATISGGSINNVTVIAGGAGYKPGSTVDVWGIGGTGCAALSGKQNIGGGVVVTAQGTGSTNSSGVVTSVTMGQAGSGCSTAPTLIFGDNTCWDSGTSQFDQQCTNLAPMQPTKVPVQVALIQGVSWEGSAAINNPIGVTSRLYGVWDSTSADNNQPVMFGANQYFSNMSVNGLGFSSGYIGIGASFTMAQATLANSVFNTGIGVVTAGQDNVVSVHDLTFYGQASMVSGGIWASRLDAPSVAGGYVANNYSTYNIFDYSYPYQANAVAASIDNWFAATFFHPEFTANATDMLETCTFPQTPNQRQTSHSIPAAGYNGGGNSLCYPGITNWGLIDLPKQFTGDEHLISNIIAIAPSRGLYYGAGVTLDQGVCCEGGTQIASDPYRTGATLHAPIIVGGNNTITNTGAYISHGTVTQIAWWLGQAGGIPTYNSSWKNIVCQNGCSSNPTQLGQQVFNQAIYDNQGATLQFLTLPNTGGRSLYVTGWPGSGNAMLDLSCTLCVSFTPGTYNSASSGGTVLGSTLGSYNSNADFMDFNANGGSRVFTLDHTGAMSLMALAVNGGTSATGSVGNGGKLQETTSANKTAGLAAFDSNGNTVNATSSNVGSLLPAASTVILGGVKCDGTTTVCAGDGTISASTNGGGLLTTSGGQTISTANTTSGLPSGCVQYPCVVSSGTQSYSGTASQSGQLSSAPAGTYLLCSEAHVAVAGTSGNFYLGTVVTSDGHAYSNPGGALGVAVATLYSENRYCFQINVEAGTTVTFQLNAVSVVGTPTVRWTYSATRLF